MTRRNSFATALVLGAAALACTAPTPALVASRSNCDSAESHLTVGRFASVQTYEAKQALDRAESEWSANGDVDETEHLAGLASKRVDIARVTANGQQSVAEVQALLKQKDAVLLAARDREITSLKTAASDAQRQRQEQIQRLQLEQTERGLLMTLADVLFDVDSTGSDYNLDLSQRRADAVRDCLADDGVPSSRMIATGYGKAYPKDDNASSVGRQANRRVEATILDPGVQAAMSVRTPPVGAAPRPQRGRGSLCLDPRGPW
jgi:outer membrane protein OmpA-like peptidoglycan-associated protein